MDIIPELEYVYSRQPRSWVVRDAHSSWLHAYLRAEVPMFDPRIDSTGEFPCVVHGMVIEPEHTPAFLGNSLVDAGVFAVLGPSRSQNYRAITDFAAKLLETQWAGFATQISARIDDLVEQKVAARLVEQRSAVAQHHEELGRIADQVARKAKSTRTMSLHDALAIVDVTALTDED